MPHYPDDIEYSDKYMDDFYEYRHVLLPKEVYKKLPRGRLLTESVRITSFRNGAHLEFSNQEDGYITNFIAQNLTFFSLEDQKELILKLEILLLDSCLLQILSSTPDIIHLITLLSAVCFD
jgi:cyclin-dependent kinase regulatory subunit CKS1